MDEDTRIMDTDVHLDRDAGEGECADETVGTLCDSIETNLWLADAYFLQGATGLAVECLREAWLEYQRFSAVLDVYAGRELVARLVHAMTERPGPFGALAGISPDAPAVMAA